MLCKAFLLAFSSSIFAAQIDVNFDINLTSKYDDCKPIAKKIVGLVENYIHDEDAANKQYYEHKIKRKKRKLKKCEKNNKKWHRKFVGALGGAQVGVTHNF